MYDDRGMMNSRADADMSWGRAPRANAGGPGGDRDEQDDNRGPRASDQEMESPWRRDKVDDFDDERRGGDGGGGGGGEDERDGRPRASDQEMDSPWRRGGGAQPTGPVDAPEPPRTFRGDEDSEWRFGQRPVLEEGPVVMPEGDQRNFDDGWRREKGAAAPATAEPEEERRDSRPPPRAPEGRWGRAERPPSPEPVQEEREAPKRGGRFGSRVRGGRDGGGSVRGGGGDDDKFGRSFGRRAAPTAETAKPDGHRERVWIGTLSADGATIAFVEGSQKATWRRAKATAGAAAQTGFAGDWQTGWPSAPRTVLAEGADGAYTATNYGRDAAEIPLTKREASGVAPAGASEIRVTIIYKDSGRKTAAPQGDGGEKKKRGGRLTPPSPAGGGTSRWSRLDAPPAKKTLAAAKPLSTSSRWSDKPKQEPRATPTRPTKSAEELAALDARMAAIREKNKRDKAAGAVAAAGPKVALAAPTRKSLQEAAPKKGRGGKSAEEIAALDARMAAIREKNKRDKAAGSIGAAGPKISLATTRGSLKEKTAPQTAGRGGKSAEEMAALDARMAAIREKNKRDKASGSMGAAGPKISLATTRGSLKEATPKKGRGGKSAEEIAALDARMAAIREKNKRDKASGSSGAAGPKVSLSVGRGALEKVNASGKTAAEEAALDEKIKQMRLRRGGKVAKKGPTGPAGPALPPGAKKSSKKSSLPFAEMEEVVRTLRTELTATAADDAAFAAMESEDVAKLEKKVKSFLSEYSTSHDHREAMLCIGELECPGYHWIVARSVLVAICEAFKPAEVEAYGNLLAEMRYAVLDEASMLRAVDEIGVLLDDIKMDAPNAPKYLKSALSFCVGHSPPLLDVNAMGIPSRAALGLGPSPVVMMKALLESGKKGKAMLTEAKSIGLCDNPTDGPAVLQVVLDVRSCRRLLLLLLLFHSLAHVTKTRTLALLLSAKSHDSSLFFPFFLSARSLSLSFSPPLSLHSISSTAAPATLRSTFCSPTRMKTTSA